MAEPIENTPLVILAGGEGTRMGKPKGLLQLAGKPILEYLRGQINWPGPLWLITAPGREHPPGCSAFDRELVDPEPGLGPLRGVLTAIENLSGPMLAIATVDMPLVRADQLRFLLNHLRSHPHLHGTMYRRRVTVNSDQIEPFPLALRHEAADAIRARLLAGRRSVWRLLDDPLFESLPAPPEWPPHIWHNLNEPEDLERFREKE